MHMRFRVSYLAVLMAVPEFARSERGTITGTISDRMAAVISSAPVQARNAATGAAFNAGQRLLATTLARVAARHL